MSLFNRNKKQVTNPDFEALKEDISWFIKGNSKIELSVPTNVKLSQNFRDTFPKLFEIIDEARQTHLTVGAESYILFAWDTVDGKICGWINKQENSGQYDCELIEEHELLLGSIGGIQESFNEPEDAFSNNQNYLFVGSECSRGIGGWNDYYSMACEDEGKEQLDYSSLVSFAYEANGALTLYDSNTKKVFLFSHDHSFDNVEFIQNQPEYTFHTFKNADSFVDYVEALAEQWREIIKFK